jgi:hypothetical protein
MTVLGLFQLRLLPQDLGLCRWKTLTLRQLSESLANRTGGRVMSLLTINPRNAYYRSPASSALGVTLMFVTAEMCAQGMSSTVAIAEVVCVIA